jgi:hypothetical protein
MMHQHFNIQQLYHTFCLDCIYLFCFYLRTNSDLCHLQNNLIGFYNRDEKCLHRGTVWVFKYSSLRFVFKRLKNMGHAVAQLVEALRYKSEVRGFDFRWCHWNFSLT